MEKIKSFKVDHTRLLSGLYQSRKDIIDFNTIINTYDLRLTRSNIEPALGTAEIHTIEHLGATYLRNHPEYKSRIIYFGPMGCRTGFYLVMLGVELHLEEDILPLVTDMFKFICNYKGQVPGSNSKECGNYRDLNLPAAKVVAEKYLKLLKNIKPRNMEYFYL